MFTHIRNCAGGKELRATRKKIDYERIRDEISHFMPSSNYNMPIKWNWNVHLCMSLNEANEMSTCEKGSKNIFPRTKKN